jgi:DNA-binding NtrC family response regulator
MNGSGPHKAVLVGDDREWPADLEDSLGRDGYLVDHVTELSLVPSLLTNGTMRALFVAARPLAASDLLLLRRVRETSPGTAIVVVARTPTHPDLKRAFESGATAFLSWPSSIDSLRQAIESGSLPAAPGAPRLS